MYTLYKYKMYVKFAFYWLRKTSDNVSDVQTVSFVSSTILGVHRNCSQGCDSIAFQITIYTY